MKVLTGQLITRPAGKSQDGRDLVMIYGIVAVDPDSPLKKEGMQYIVTGSSDFEQAGRILPINLHQDAAIDRSKETDGNTPGSVMMAPIWRV